MVEAWMDDKDWPGDLVGYNFKNIRTNERAYFHFVCYKK